MNLVNLYRLAESENIPVYCFDLPLTRSMSVYNNELYAIKKLIPKDELKNAADSGITEVWELAEYFNVTEDFVKRAIYIYGCMQ